MGLSQDRWSADICLTRESWDIITMEAFNGYRSPSLHKCGSWCIEMTSSLIMWDFLLEPGLSLRLVFYSENMNEVWLSLIRPESYKPDGFCSSSLRIFTLEKVSHWIRGTATLWSSLCQRHGVSVQTGNALTAVSHYSSNTGHTNTVAISGV